jgi:polar amino acid transport system substrate-binding protein
MTQSRVPMSLAAVAICALALFVAGCGDSDDDGSGAEGGTLTVGSDIPYPPFEQGKAPNYTGFDIELVEAMAEKIGRTAEFQDTSFDTIFRDLAQGKFEMVASATTITDEREKSVDFTDPYYLPSEQAILVVEGSDIASVADLDGETVGVQQGTTGEEYVEEETDAGEVRTYPQGPDTIPALKAGTVDAVVIDRPVAEEAVEKESGIEISASAPTEEEYGYVVQQDNEDLLTELNEALQEVKDDGTYTRIFRKWFNQAPPQEVFTATHDAS